MLNVKCLISHLTKMGENDQRRHTYTDFNMAVGCMFYVLLLVTQLLEFTRECAANKDVRRENHHKYTGYYKIKDSL